MKSKEQNHSPKTETCGTPKNWKGNAGTFSKGNDFSDTKPFVTDNRNSVLLHLADGSQKSDGSQTPNEEIIDSIEETIFCDKKTGKIKGQYYTREDMLKALSLKDEEIQELRKYYEGGRDLLNETIEDLMKKLDSKKQEIDENNQFCRKCEREQKQKEKDFLKILDDLKQKDKESVSEIRTDRQLRYFKGRADLFGEIKKQLGESKLQEDKINIIKKLITEIREDKNIMKELNKWMKSLE